MRQSNLEQSAVGTEVSDSSDSVIKCHTTCAFNPSNPVFTAKALVKTITLCPKIKKELNAYIHDKLDESGAQSLATNQATPSTYTQGNMGHITRMMTNI